MRILRSTAVCFGFALALAACGRDKSEPAAGPSQECIERTSTLAAALAEIPAGGVTITWPGNVLVVLDEAVKAEREAEDGVVIYAHNDSLSMDHADEVRAYRRTEAKEALKIEFEIAARTGRSKQVLVVAREDATWAVMVTLFSALSELGETDVDLLFARDLAIPPIPASAMTEALIAVHREPAATRITSYSNLATELVEQCPALDELFTSFATLDPDARLQALVTGTPKALQACDCKADVESVTAFAHSLIAPEFVPAVVRVELASKSDEAAELLELPAATTWQAAHVRVVGSPDRPKRYAVQTTLLGGE